MEKIAFKMKLKPGAKEEYIKRHEAIWAALRSVLKEYKISDYSIFLDEETNTLFAVQKKSGEKDSQDMGNNEIFKKWWEYMADLMETNPDNSPITIPLKKVFHMD
jgi:L-rhamnose mutarotase